MPTDPRESTPPPARGPRGDGDHDATPLPSPLPGDARDRSPERAEDRLEPGTSKAAGPHSQPSLTNPDATPGAGTLPDVDADAEGDVGTDAATG